jgi:hypothetical protein
MNNLTKHLHEHLTDLTDKLKFAEAVMVALYHATDDIAIKSKDKKLRSYGRIVKNYTAKALATIRDVPLDKIENDLYEQYTFLPNNGDTVTTIYNENSLHLN